MVAPGLLPPFPESEIVKGAVCMHPGYMLWIFFLSDVEVKSQEWNK